MTWIRCKKPEQLRKEFLDLLNENKEENAYQAFLENNTFLIPREFVLNHGLHFQLVIRKLRFGADFVCDFAYLTKSSAKWHCVLIEIEKPSSLYFRKSGTQYHSDFTSALQQISDWRAWFEDASNKDSFVKTCLSLLITRLTWNPVHLKYVLVHGRRSEFESNSFRLAKIRAEERDDFRIMSFDSLAEDLRNKSGLYIASRHNKFMRILSDEFAGDSMFGSMSPESLKVGVPLRSALEQVRGRAGLNLIVDGKSKDAIDHYLDSTQVDPVSARRRVRNSN